MWAQWKLRPKRFHWILAGLILTNLAAALLFQQIRETRSLTTLYVTRIPSGPLFVSEDPLHPQLVQLRKQEHIDAVISQASTDLARLLRLAQWASQQFQASTPFPNYPPWNARIILQQIRQGKTGGFCAQYAFVFGQVCQSLGYNIRYVGIANHAKSDGHALLEVYVPSLAKWVIFEPEFGRYYTNGSGTPLSALDLHRYAVGELKGRVLEFPSGHVIEPRWLDLFYNFKYMLRNNFISIPVYHYYKVQPGGIELLFEPYELRWLDTYTAHARVAQPTLTSHTPEDFDFHLDLSGRAEDVTCRTAADFASFIKTAVPLKLYRLKLPHFLLTQIVEQLLIQDSRFKPLK